MNLAMKFGTSGLKERITLELELELVLVIDL